MENGVPRGPQNRAKIQPSSQKVAPRGCPEGVLKRVLEKYACGKPPEASKVVFSLQFSMILAICRGSKNHPKKLPKWRPNGFQIRPKTLRDRS